MAVVAVSAVDVPVSQRTPVETRPSCDEATRNYVRFLPETAIGDEADGNCGVYSAYLALNLMKPGTVSVDALWEPLGRNDGVCSVQDLVNAVRQHGAPTATAVRIKPEELRKLRLPAIAYRQGSNERNGHLVVFARRHGNLIQVIDYPSYVVWVPLERLQQFTVRWQGDLVLLREPGAVVRPWQAAAFGASSAWLAIGFVVLTRRLLRKRRERASKALQPPAIRS